MILMNLKLFYSSVFFQHLAYGIIIPILIIWQHQNGLRFTEIGLIQAIGVLIVLATEIPSSFFADKIGKKITLILAFLFSIVSFFFLIIARDVWGFLIAQCFLSVGIAFFSGTQEGTLHDLIGRDKKMTQYLGKMSIIDETATILGMGASSLTIMLFSISKSFWFGFLSMCLGLFAIFCMTLSKQISQEKIQRDERYLLHWKNTGMIMVILFFAFLSTRGESLFQARFDLLNTELAQLGILYVMAKIFSIVGSGIAHTLEEKMNTFRSFLFILIIQIAAFGFLFLMSTFAVIVSLALFFFSENIFRNIRDAWILEKAPQDLRATYLSTMNFSSSLLLLALNPLIGLGIDKKIAFGILLIVSAKILGGMLFMKKEARRLFA